MDDSRKPGNSAPTKYPWQNDEAAGEDMGATGMFGTTPDSRIEGGSDPITQPGQEENSGERGELRGSAPQAAALGGREGPKEPVVHKVVLGSGSATAPIDLLELLRISSPKAEPAPGPALADPQALPWTAPFQTAPATPSGPPPAQSSEGFTQLLRALGGDSMVASTAKRPEAIQQTVASSDSHSGRPESGFTALAGTQNTDDRHEQPKSRPDVRTPAPGASPSDGAGGFTALLQGFSGNAPNSGARQQNSRPLDEISRPILPEDTPSAPVYPSGQAEPGAFTQLFSALTSEPAEPAVTNPGRPNASAIYAERGPVSRPSGGEPSFTQLISTIGEASSKTSTFGDNRPPLLEDFTHKPSPGREDTLGSSQPPTGIADWSRAPAPQPEPSSGSGGLTQLLRTLDEPAKGPEMPTAYPPAGAPAPSPGSGSLFTQTYKKLDEPVEPLSPTSPSSKLSATQPFASPVTGGIFPDQGPAGPVAPILPAGPSDVTRIIDASKLREMQRQGIAAPPAGPAVAAQPSPSQPAMPMPPAPPYLQWQPPQVPPVPLPGQPPQFNPAMQMPQFMPPAQVPPIPTPALAAPPALGKMQQYLPLFAIIIIFLLIVILVTVVFLLKH
jgi:hypothetical protein